jgi:glutamate synthase domain-containing protein 3
MTGGQVIVLGKTGRNFAAGMSGGVAYVLDEKGQFAENCCNQEVVDLDQIDSPEELADLQTLIEQHVALTGSELGQRVLKNWKSLAPRFVKVMPKDYKRALLAFKEVEAAGLSGDEAVMAAFEMNKNDVARVSGN